MSKKSNPEKGLRTVSIDFAGKQRTLKFTHSSIGDFEVDCNRILRSIDVVKDGMLFADSIITSWLGNARIFSYALLHGLKHEATNEDPITLEIVDAAIDLFIESGGLKTDLMRDVILAYRYATNPSSVASLKRSWQISDDRQKILTDAENQQMDAISKAIAEVRAKTIPGLPLSASES